MAPKRVRFVVDGYHVRAEMLRPERSAKYEAFRKRLRQQPSTLRLDEVPSSSFILPIEEVEDHLCKRSVEWLCRAKQLYLQHIGATGAQVDAVVWDAEYDRSIDSKKAARAACSGRVWTEQERAVVREELRSYMLTLHHVAHVDWAGVARNPDGSTAAAPVAECEVRRWIELWSAWYVRQYEAGRRINLATHTIGHDWINWNFRPLKISTGIPVQTGIDARLAGELVRALREGVDQIVIVSLDSDLTLAALAVTEISAAPEYEVTKASVDLLTPTHIGKDHELRRAALRVLSLAPEPESTLVAS